jgi:hypothetical protein
MPCWTDLQAGDVPAAKAQAPGGSVLAPAADIPGSGRMAFVAAPAGLPIGISATLRDPRSSGCCGTPIELNRTVGSACG